MADVIHWNTPPGWERTPNLRHWLLGRSSGHGFKPAPALGELLADAVEGTGQPPAMLAPAPRLARSPTTGR